MRTSCSRASSSASRSFHFVLRALERLARGEATAPQILLSFQVLTGKIQRDARLLDRGARLLQRRLRGGDAGLTALQLSFERLRVDFQQKLPGADALSFLDGQPCHAPHRVGGNIDLTLWLDLARRRNDRLEIAAARRFHGDGRSIAAAKPERQTGAGDDDDDDADDPGPLSPHAVPPVSAIASVRMPASTTYAPMNASASRRAGCPIEHRHADCEHDDPPDDEQIDDAEETRERRRFVQRREEQIVRVVGLASVSRA